MKAMGIEQKLGIDKFVVDEGNPHIVLDMEKCRDCDLRPCIMACPASLYKAEDGGGISFDFAGCLECGSCRVVCPNGALSWNHPRPTFGIFYRYG
jgi:ferredoxin like protein